ncbi:hypothetical protein GX586_09440 [bacterium]|nr:hypothetical protein [bacterium]
MTDNAIAAAARAIMRCRIGTTVIAAAFSVCGMAHGAGALPADEDSRPRSLTWCLSTGLEQLGITASCDSVDAHLGSVFSLGAVTGDVCLSRAVDVMSEPFLTNLLDAFGLSAARFPFTEAAWTRAVVRQFFRSRIAGALIETNLAVVRGGWGAPAGLGEWGVATAMDETGQIDGAVRDGAARHKLRPDELIIFSRAASPAPVETARIGAIAALVRVLRNQLRNGEGSRAGAAGVEAFERVCDRAHHVPACPACGDASRICLYAALTQIGRDARSLARYLESMRGDCTVEQRDHLLAAVAELDGLRRGIDRLAEPEAMRTAFASPTAQAAWAEKLRGLRAHFWHAANALAAVAGIPVRDPVVHRPALIRKDAFERRIMRILPLYQDLRDGSMPLLCSAAIALQFMGSDETPEWLKSMGGATMRFLVDTNTFAPVAESDDDAGQGDAIFRAGGYAARRFLCGPGDPQRVRDAMLFIIADAIDLRKPVLMRGLMATNDWGVIVGYERYGRSIICRTPYDTTSAFRVTNGLPREVVVLEPAVALSAAEQLRRTLARAVAFARTNEIDGRLSGLAALTAWHGQCTRLGALEMPPAPAFARNNAALWAGLRDMRRETYAFLDTACARIPIVAIPLSNARNAYVKEVNILGDALADGRVLRLVNGVPTPPTWHLEQWVDQCKALEAVIALEKEALSHIEIALKQLGE